MRQIFIILVCVIMAGCATTAQKQATFIRESMQAADLKIKPCLHKIVTNPAYKPLAEHMSLNGNVAPTFPQLLDKGVPDENDIKLLLGFHNDVTTCREEILADYMKFLPGVVPTIIESYHEMDNLTIDVIQKKITWGEYNKQKLALHDKFLVKGNAIAAQIDRELQASHQAELAQRQAAVSAILQYSQQKKLINTLNQPVITDCSGNNYSVHCSSYRSNY